MIDVVLLLQVLGECRNVGSKLSTFSSFLILYSGESLTSFHKNKRANFSGERSTMKLSGVSIFCKIRESWSSLSSHLQVYIHYKADTTVTVMSIHNL